VEREIADILRFRPWSALILSLLTAGSWHLNVMGILVCGFRCIEPKNQNARERKLTQKTTKLRSDYVAISFLLEKKIKTQ
jgi:hypothetical protein